MSDGVGEDLADAVAETPGEMAELLRQAAETGDTIVVHGADGTSVRCVIDRMMADCPLTDEADEAVPSPWGEVYVFISGGDIREQLGVDAAEVTVEEGAYGDWDEAELRWEGDGDDLHREEMERIVVLE